MNTKKILVATDFGEPAGRALDCAIDLAAALGASVTVVHALDLPMYGSGATAVAAALSIPEIERASKEALDAALAERRGRGVSLTGMVREGHARDEILAVAKEIGASMLVVGTHGRKGLERALLGSVAERIVRTAPCPVLVVPLEPLATGPHVTPGA